MSDVTITISGAQGKSAYQSYLDTTTDDPVKTEAQWSETAIGNHEDLTGLLGGAANDHQHLTSAELAAVQDIAATPPPAFSHNAGSIFSAFPIDQEIVNFTINMAVDSTNVNGYYELIGLVGGIPVWGRVVDGMSVVGDAITGTGAVAWGYQSDPTRGFPTWQVARFTAGVQDVSPVYEPAGWDGTTFYSGPHKVAQWTLDGGAPFTPIDFEPTYISVDPNIGSVKVGDTKFGFVASNQPVVSVCYQTEPVRWAHFQPYTP